MSATLRHPRLVGRPASHLRRPPGGLWTAAWGKREDGLGSVASSVFSACDPPRRPAVRDCPSCGRPGPLPFQAGFQNEFLIESSRAGSRLTVIQDGLPTGPQSDELCAVREIGRWETPRSLKAFLEGEEPRA